MKFLFYQGFFIECDLRIPRTKHDLFDFFPLAPTASVINYSDLSPYSQQSVKENNKAAKLICDLRPKNHYVLSHRNLNFYLSQGMILENVHRVLGFDQEPIARGKYLTLVSKELREHQVR